MHRRWPVSNPYPAKPVQMKKIFAEILGDCGVGEASTPCECLADGCRALEEEWDSIRAGTAEPAGALWGMAALADDRLVLDMLTQRWE